MATVKTNGVELYYERRGGGEPLLLVHGLLFSGESWREQADALSGEYEVITVDLRGQHRSETTDDPAGYDLWNQAEDIHGLIQALGVVPVHYAGLSMGGMIGMRLALRHPADLRDLILLDTAADGEDPEKAERYAAMRHIQRKGEVEAILPALPPVFFADAYVSEHADRVDAWFKTLIEGNQEGFAFASQLVDERDDITDQLSAVQLPTLVIHGTEDVPIPVEKAQAIAAAIPGARLELVEGAGHQSNMDHPEEVTRLIREFLASVRSSAPASRAG
ncbi:MAG TPA: alpha/beta fold hydrolase [Candidatus Dormibacteraeota bacterium]|jgi:pimeloyl-ACP methyl ester carboxylesterase